MTLWSLSWPGCEGWVQTGAEKDARGLGGAGRRDARDLSSQAPEDLEAPPSDPAPL